MKNLPVMNLHHVGYVVKDRDAFVASLKKDYDVADVLAYDFRPGKAWCNGEEQGEYLLKIAMVKLNHNDTLIEAIEPISAGIHKDFVDSTGGGIHHLCFSVEQDYDLCRDYFAQNGAEFIFESETEDDITGYRRCFYMIEESGNVMEVKEKPYFRTKK